MAEADVVGLSAMRGMRGGTRCAGVLRPSPPNHLISICAAEARFSGSKTAISLMDVMSLDFAAAMTVS